MEAPARPWHVVPGVYDTNPETASEFPHGPEIMAAGGAHIASCDMYGEEAAELLVHAVNNIERITAERDLLLSEVECLNSNARVQAKLLADTGREREELEEALQKIESWSEAYPIDIFPEPDLKKARELLAAGGITLDAISAHCMRHVVEGVGKIARAALTPSVPDAER